MLVEEEEEEERKRESWPAVFTWIYPLMDCHG